MFGNFSRQLCECLNCHHKGSNFKIWKGDEDRDENPCWICPYCGSSDIKEIDEESEEEIEESDEIRKIRIENIKEINEIIKEQLKNEK